MEEVKPINLETEKPTKEAEGQAPVTPASASAPGHKLKITKKGVIIFLLIILAGTASGYGLQRLTGPKLATQGSKQTGELTKGTSFGIMDEETFSDTAEGTLEKGGINGEGSHHLVREGGESQNVYLTSSILDLDQFVGKKVKVWGETFEAQKAGWLMDVGRLEIQE
jgi:hypothetical protein